MITLILERGENGYAWRRQGEGRRLICNREGHTLLGLPPGRTTDDYPTEGNFPAIKVALQVSLTEVEGWTKVDRGGDLYVNDIWTDHYFGLTREWDELFPENYRLWVRALPGQILKEITFCRRRVEGYDGEDVEYGWDGESARICFSEAERWLGWPRDVPDGTERTLRIWDAPADGRVPVRLGETGCFLGPPPGCWTIMWPQTMRALRLAAGTLDTVWVDSV